MAEIVVAKDIVYRLLISFCSVYKSTFTKKSTLCVSDTLSISIPIYLLFVFNVILAGKDELDTEQLLK